MERDGFGEYFPHLSGHGVGLSIHESPIIDRGVEMVLSPGMVTTIEPGIYFPGVGAAWIEDMVLITETGHELFDQDRKGSNLKRNFPLRVYEILKEWGVGSYRIIDKQALQEITYVPVEKLI